MMAGISDAAAALGIPCFPCGADKRPVIATGFKAATLDPAQIRAAFDRPGAELIGVPTGAVSGWVVIDIDIRPDRDGNEWLQENAEKLPPTRTHKTRSGGLHLIFQNPAGVEIRNSASRIAPGVDVRGEGGYVIVPPSPGYAVADAIEPAEMPVWLIHACAPPVREQRPPSPPQPPREHGGSRYGLAALADECNAVRRASFGQQESTLNAAGLKIGALVAGGEIEEGAAIAELLAAGRSMSSESGRDAWAPDEIENKVRRAFKAGHARPRKAPERHEEHAPPEMEPGYWDALGLDPELFRAEEIPPPEDEPETVEEGIKSGHLLPFFTFADASARLDVDDFVEGLLTVRSMGVIYGESNSGKTFFATDLALHVAASRPWRGREIDGGLVIYLALEGSLGIRNRITAWKEASGLADYDLPFIVVPVSVNLLDPDADAAAVIATVKAVAAQFNVLARLIVIDTLSRAMAGGNENAPEDMTSLIGTGDIIRQQTGACLLWIHHSGKDSARGARGHSSLRAATDTEIEITVDGATRMARVTKQRDLDGAGEFPFSLKVIELGENRRGKPVTSCVVETVNDQAPGGASGIQRRLTGHTKRAFEVLTDLIVESGQADHKGVPGGLSSVPEKWWRERFYDRAMPGADQDSKKRAFRRAADTLVETRYAAITAGRVWLPRRPEGTE